MNLFSKITTLLLLLPTLTTALFFFPFVFPPTRPSTTTLPHNPNAHWDFDLYNNRRCTGPASKATGFGSSGCRTDVPPGGARGYSLKDLDATCSVTLYMDDACTRRQRVGSVGVVSVRGCHSIRGRGRFVRSFEVKCR